ncbi:MAG: PKD domain-containing protein [Fulvivirga sp.]
MQKKSLVLLALMLCLAASIYYFKSSTDTVTDKLSQIHEMAKKDRPDLAAEQEFEMTKDPNLGYPPVQRKITAFKEAQKLLGNKKRAKAIDNVIWEERGPDNVGGRTRALIWDPNDPSGKKVFSGTVAGGLWYNNDITDTESVWQNVDDFMANLAISTLAYDPNNTQIFYAGTGLGFTGRLRGAGIWKSVDGGANWEQLTSTINSEFYYNQKIIVTSTSRVIAATDDGLKVSDDGGSSWTDVIASTNMADIEIEDDGVNGETLYASDFDGGIYKSTDDGDNWSDISPGDAGDRVELAVAPTDVNTVYAVAASGTSVGWFKKSTDGGTNWTDITIPSYLEQGSCAAGSNDFTRGQAWFDLILAVYPNDPSSVIAGGIDLHRTTDGGTNWESLSYWTGQCDDYVHADQHAIVFKDGSDSEAIFGNDGGVFYSNELDQSNPEFEETILGYNTALFYATAATNVAGSNVYLAGAQDNGSNLFTTAGINSAIEVTGGDGAFCFIDQDNPNLMITSYVYNNYYITTNSWSSFSSTDSDNSGNFINQADYDDETDILYATRNANEIAVYSNISSGSASKSVKSVSIGGRQTSNLKVSPYTDNRVIVGTEGGEVYIIDNANATTPTVTNIDNNDLPNGNVSSIDIGESDDHLLVTYSNYGVTSVWETTDGGDTWNNKEGNLPDMPIRWGLYNPNNRSEVLLATEVGVWSTDDITATTPEWEPTSEGLANVRCDMLQYRESDQQVVVATFGRGLYTSYAFLEGAAAAFETDTKITYVGKTVSFDNKSVGDVSSYEWNFGDGITSTDEDVNHAYTTPGTYTVSLEVNGGEDTRSDIITVLPNRDGDYSLTDGGDFDEYIDDFYADNVAGTPFELGSSSIDQKDGTVSGVNAWVTGLDDEQYLNNSTAYLYTPNFDLSTAGSYTLSFETKYSFEPEWEGFIVEYSLDSGSTWTKLNPVIESGWYNETTVENSVFGNEAPIFGGDTGGEFVEMSTDISAFSGDGRVAFRFSFKTDPGTTDVGMALDDFMISGPTQDAIPNFAVSDQSLSTCAETEVTFHDLSEGDITSWSWDFGTGASPATATGRGPHVVSYSSTGSADVSLTVIGETNGSQNETKLAYINILTNPVIEKVVAVADENLCYGESTTITIENADSGFTYQVFDADNDDALNQPISGDGTNIVVNTPELLASVSYYVLVKQKNSNCSKVLDDQVSVTIDPPVLSNTVISEDDICAGETISASIDLAQSGVNYYFINTSTMNVLGDQIEGQDGELTITTSTLTEAVDVMVMATSIGTSCELALTEETSINVRELPDATITDDGAILSAPIGGIVYQWVLDGDTLETETSRSITVNSFGEYQVIVTANGCTSISDVFSPVVLGVEELIESGELSFYPNPTRGAVNLNQKGLFNYLKIYDYNGRIVESRNILNNEIISLHQYNDGIYLFELTGPNKQATFRINKVD